MRETRGGEGREGEKRGGEERKEERRGVGRGGETHSMGNRLSWLWEARLPPF